MKGQNAVKLIPHIVGNLIHVRTDSGTYVIEVSPVHKGGATAFVYAPAEFADYPAPPWQVNGTCPFAIVDSVGYWTPSGGELPAPTAPVEDAVLRYARSIIAASL